MPANVKVRSCHQRTVPTFLRITSLSILIRFSLFDKEIVITTSRIQEPSKRRSNDKGRLRPEKCLSGKGLFRRRRCLTTKVSSKVSPQYCKRQIIIYFLRSPVFRDGLSYF